MTLIDRLIFGTAHLYGGPYTRQSLALLDDVRQAGVTMFDTAPLYGAGTAEAVLGKVFGHDPGVTIATKVGLARPTMPLARAWARKGLRTVRGARAKAHPALAAAPGTGPSPGGWFDPDLMARSFHQSVSHLRRDPDTLLLHECAAAPGEPAHQFLHGLIAEGRVTQVGYANGDTFAPALDALMPARWQAQAAIPAQLLTAPMPLPDRPLVLHSLIGMGAWLEQRDPTYAQGLARVRGQFGNLAPAALWPALLPYCLAAVHAPQARLIFATSQRERAGAFLGALAAIDRAQALQALVAAAKSAPDRLA